MVQTARLPEAPSAEGSFSPEEAGRIYQAQQDFFQSGATRSYAFRREQLLKLQGLIRRHEQEIMDALHRDLRKSPFEAYSSEVGVLYNEIRHTLRHLRRWMRPRRVSTPPLFLPSSSRIIRDPLGVVLVIGPWNYPFLLMMNPLVSAIAGGNTAVLKPSDQSVHTSRLISRIISENFDPAFIAVMEGPGHVVGPELISRYRFDHIFFTGSVNVGRQIMELASKHLSTVTLELGGKSPCIIDREVDVDQAARKVAWSKLFNAGQTCVAPDYVLVHADVKDAFLGKLKGYFTSMLEGDGRKSDSYGRIINRKRFDTVVGYFEEGRVAYGGEHDAEDLFIAPTILEDVAADARVMREEIFGPVLPLITYRDRQEVLAWVARNPYPLALYLYTSSRDTERFYMENVRFGGGCVNNGIIHLGNPDLPFGGVGTSGMGQYHGRWGFDTFTRPKGVVRTPAWFDVPLWYAPYKDHLKWVKLFFKL